MTALLTPKMADGAILGGELLAATARSLVTQINALESLRPEPTGAAAAAPRRRRAHRPVSLHGTVASLVQHQAKLAVRASLRAFRQRAPPAETARGRLALALPTASLELLLRNATQTAFDKFVSLAPRVGAHQLQPYAEQLQISLDAEARLLQLAHESAARLAAASTAERRLRKEREELQEELEHLERLRHQGSIQQHASSGWHEALSNALLLLLASGSVMMPSGMAPAPIAKLAPSILSAASVWRIAHRPLGRWAKQAASSVRGLIGAGQGSKTEQEDATEGEREQCLADVPIMAKT